MSPDRLRTALQGTPFALAALAATTVLRHLDDHPSVAVSRVLRAAPGALPRVASRWLRGTGWEPLALAAAGRREEARRAVDTLARTPRGRVGAAAATYALHDMAAAAAVLESTGTGDAADRYARALCLRTLGRLAEAESAVAPDSDRRARRLRRRLAAELEMLRPTGRAPLPLGTGPATLSPGPGEDPVVLHLVTNALPETQAGYTTRTQGILRALRAQGVDARVAPRAGFPVVDGHVRARAEVTVDGVPYLRTLPLGLPLDVAALARADADHRARLAEQVGAGVLHAHSNYLNGRAALAARDRTGVPVVYEVRGMLEETWRSRGGDADADRYHLTRASETEVMRSADAVVVISEVLRQEVLDRGVDPARVLLVPNAVDDRFLQEPPDPTALREQLGIGRDDVLVGTISTLNDYEGLDVLVDAIGLLRAEGDPVRLLVVGSGPAASRLRDRARTLGDGVAVLPGRVPFADVHRYHAALDVFAVPRLDLPVTALVPPLKPLEAMASGRPVVGSDLPPLREIVRDGETGALARPGDPEALAAALAGLVREPDRRRRYGRRAREIVLAERTWAHAAQRYRGLYRALHDV